jgi:hypothetical protein
MHRFLICLAALVALPPAINLSYLANNETWQEAGRVVIGYAYVVPFLIIASFVHPWSQRLGRTFAVVGIYGFVLIAIQENNSMAMKSLHEVELTSRIVGRVEQIIPDATARPLVVFGRTTFPYGKRLVEPPDRPFRNQFDRDIGMFGPWRQVEIMNFFLGRDLLKSPTVDDIAVAAAAAEKRMPWPSPESVFLAENVVVVLLQRPGPGVFTTWTADQK